MSPEEAEGQDCQYLGYYVLKGKDLPKPDIVLCPTNIIKCNSCLEEKEEYVSGCCKECSDKMDKHIEGNKEDLQ